MLSIPEIRDVVMVDDHEGDIQIARLCFAKSRLSNPWCAFNDGRQYLSHLQIARSSPETLPSLVLLDINMRPIDGFQCLERTVQLFGSEPPFPIVMLTHSDRDADRHRARDLGATALYTKPNTIADYVAFFDGFAPELVEA